MDSRICETCGTEYPPTTAPPSRCAICEEERQYVSPSGQKWTDLSALRRTHRNVFVEQESGLIGIGMEPHFAIGQRALLVSTGEGNFLWDCVPLIDELTQAAVEKLGGIKAIAISHPHYYSSMVSWSERFAGIPIFLHEADREWAMRRDGNIEFWSGGTKVLGPGLTLIRCGGHFAGGTVLHWSQGAAGKGALLTGDVLQVAPDRQHVSFMRSYPNYIPLSAGVIERIMGRIRSVTFDRIYGAFWDRVIASNARASVIRSANRYVDAISGQGPADNEE